MYGVLVDHNSYLTARGTTTSTPCHPWQYVSEAARAADQQVLTDYDWVVVDQAGCPVIEKFDYVFGVGPYAEIGGEA